VADNARIDNLRRRIHLDPASIAFAQLAEEYRRAGDVVQAIDVCRAGLDRHPGYLSARVTLGRALMETGELARAEVEFRSVLGAAADNLAALRGLAVIHHRRGELEEALGCYERALGFAKNAPDLERAVDTLTRMLAPRVTAPSGAQSSAGRPVAPRLEQFLDAIHSYRLRRAV
jgi:tetratricopeptide (TPR) repeat protein